MTVSLHQNLLQEGASHEIRAITTVRRVAALEVPSLLWLPPLKNPKILGDVTLLEQVSAWVLQRQAQSTQHWPE